MPIPHTPPHFSVNRVRIVDLPGRPIDDAVRGQRAVDLLSSWAVVRYARARATALRLPDTFAQDTLHTRLTLPRWVDACLDSPHPTVRAAAQAIGRRLGRNLGHILLALRRGDPVNRAARPDWGAQEWAMWAGVRHVWLGGGLMSDQLGEQIVTHARATLAELGDGQGPHVACTPHPTLATLLGAACYLPAGTRHALCMDFGHTRVKRAGVDLADGTLVRLRRHDSLLTDLEWLGQGRAPNPDTGRQVLAFIADAVSQTWAACRADGQPPERDVMLSVAAYVQGGRLLGNGLYANLSTLADDVRPLLAQAIAARVPDGAAEVQVHLIHDGTAACAVHAGVPHAAVILVGTALGIGFPPSETRGLRPLADTLAVC
jgi:hypothetical protein